MKVEWKKVNPADLSVTCCADYFALSTNNHSLLVSDLDHKCTFTAVIQASANFNLSIYQMEIWVGYCTGTARFSKQSNHQAEKSFQDFLTTKSSTSIVYEPALVWEFCA